MRLLVCTQVVDKQDPFLGFMHRWIEEFAARCDHVEVICLREGEHAFPDNVRVHSLGKENGTQTPRGLSGIGVRLRYSLRFMRLIWRVRHEYTDVFVHMNVEYMILGGLLWRMLRKGTGLWYNHGADHLSLRIALGLAHIVFYTSSFAASARSHKAFQMPVGIDTELFAYRGEERKRNSIYMQGRMSAAKNVHILLGAVHILRERGISATATIVGPEDPAYGKKLRTQFAHLIEDHAVTFLGPREYTSTSTLFASHEVSVNLAPKGCFDKTVVESLACETPVVASSDALADLVPPALRCRENDPISLADTLQRALALTQQEKHTLGETGRQQVIMHHSLTALVSHVLTRYHNQNTRRGH